MYDRPTKQFPRYLKPATVTNNCSHEVDNLQPSPTNVPKILTTCKCRQKQLFVTVAGFQLHGNSCW